MPRLFHSGEESQMLDVFAKIVMTLGLIMNLILGSACERKFEAGALSGSGNLSGSTGRD